MSRVLRSNTFLQRQQSSINYWEHLPLELRIMIFKMVLDPPVERTQYIQSACATVCREWNYFFERETFNHLILHQLDVAEFCRIVQGQRKTFVKRIWLRLELPEYDCESCNKRQSTEEFKDHKFLFTNAVWDLFAFLSTWNIRGKFGVGGSGVTLELSAHSPSDSKHFCKELARRSDDTPWERNEFPEKDYHDRRHCWRHGVQIRQPSFDAMLRVFGGLNGLKFDLRAPSARKMNRTLPKVRVIKELILRRQFYRVFSVPNALQPIIESCTQLQSLSYETWRGINNKKGCNGGRLRDLGHHILFSDVFKYSRSLRKVSIFEDFSCVLRNRKRVRNPLLGRALARSSQNFTDLHAAFNVDARDFFYAFNPKDIPREKGFYAFNPKDIPREMGGMGWKLKTLSLTCGFRDPLVRDRVIRLAAVVVFERMPQLECMELWNGEWGHACVFRYQRWVERARISLLSTRRPLGAEARRFWGKVARRHGIENLQEEYVSLDARLIKSHVSVFRHLLLVDRLLQPISRYQMQFEKIYR
jgi:hypothetical protein